MANTGNVGVEEELTLSAVYLATVSKHHTLPHTFYSPRPWSRCVELNLHTSVLELTLGSLALEKASYP